MRGTVKKALSACLAAGIAVVGAGCSIFGGDEKPNTPTPTLSPIVEVSESYHGSVPPYKKNQTRGLLAEVSNYRIDFSHLELGLMEIARETFPTDEYFFQEGQQISRDQVLAWLSNPEEHPEGLNPVKGPNTLIHVLEHDYLDKKNRMLSGIVLGITLSPVYQDASGQSKLYSLEELRQKGKQIAFKIVSKVRAENQQIPMVIALYQVPDPNSTLIPGRFILTGTVSATESEVSQWQQIDEEYFLFPSDAVYQKYDHISLQYDELMKKAQSYFGEYVGMTGVGRFMGGELIELTITATAEYDSRTEVLQFTQFMASQVNQLFDKNVHINIYIQSISQPLALYVRPSEGEPYLHIYRK